MNFKDRISAGLNGKYEGLSNGFSRINDYIFGTQKGCYTLLGGQSGSAKTTLVDFMLLNALRDAKGKNINVNVFYYSLEIDEFSKKANWLSVLIYDKYKILIPPEVIKGLGKFRMTEEQQEIVNDTIPELEELWSKINWCWESINPTGIYSTIWKHMEKRGTFDRENYINEHGEVKERIVRYNNNDPHEYNIVIVDHIAS
jgi:energy-coupling factor transporter ATP-binding protein EcfA2